MGAYTSKKTEIADRRRKVSAAYLQGKTQPEIAVELAVTQATISRDLKAVREEWMQSALVDMNAAKAQELAKIDLLEIEYWQGWRRSIGERLDETTKGINVDGRLVPAEKTVKKITMLGDTRFLDGVQWCIDKRCKILGLDAPIMIDLNWQDEIIDLLTRGELAPEEVARDFGPSLAQNFFERAGVDIAHDAE